MPMLPAYDFHCVTRDDSIVIVVRAITNDKTLARMSANRTMANGRAVLDSMTVRYSGLLCLMDTTSEHLAAYAKDLGITII